MVFGDRDIKEPEIVTSTVGEPGVFDNRIEGTSIADNNNEDTGFNWYDYEEAIYNDDFQEEYVSSDTTDEMFTMDPLEPETLMSPHNVFRFRYPEATNPEATCYDLLYDDAEVDRRWGTANKWKLQSCNWPLLDRPNIFDTPAPGVPVVSVTTPEGETLYPNDMNYYRLSGGGLNWADLADEDEDEDEDEEQIVL